MVDESRSLLETPRKRQKIDWACLKTWLPISHHFHDWKAPLARASHVKWRYTKYLGFSFSFITEGHQRKASGKENPLEDQEQCYWMQWCRKMKRMRLTTQYAKLKEKAHDRETWHQCVTEKEPSFGQKTLDWTRDVDNWDLDSGNNFNKLWLWGKIKYCTVNNSGQCTFQ